MECPENTNLPLFAYGIFKPGQLCYSRIKPFVEKYEKCEISGSLLERDGIPLIVENDHGEVVGYLITLKKGDEEKAYQSIAGIEPKKIYKWGVAESGNNIANVLYGRNPDKGSCHIHEGWKGEGCNIAAREWDGNKDPFFTQSLDLVREMLNESEKKEHEGAFGNYKELFRLQMAYTLLWSAIERYAGLKYHLGDQVMNKVSRIAEEECFIESLKCVVKEKRIIYRSDNLKKETLDLNNPKKAISYYYAVRSNSIHRGKNAIGDFRIVQSSLRELLEIFTKMLEDAFKE